MTVTGVTSSQITVSWMFPDSSNNASFDQYFLSWLDTASGMGQGLCLSKENMSWRIDGLESYRQYSITVVSITAEGVESDMFAPLTVITGNSLFHSLSALMCLYTVQCHSGSGYFSTSPVHHTVEAYKLKERQTF